MELIRNKSFLTNFIAFIAAFTGFVFNINLLFTTAIFAFSGAVTNALAVHMLFEKIPFLYGSGVIPRRFLEFKQALKLLIIEEFFAAEKLENFLENKINSKDFKINIEKIDYDKIYNDLIAAIMESSLASMLSMFGGSQALEPLKQPIIAKLKLIIVDFEEMYLQKLTSAKMHEKFALEIENLIDKRLEELTPQMVKEILKKIINKYLGWLVVWGGVFGALIGFLYGLL